MGWVQKASSSYLHDGGYAGFDASGRILLFGNTWTNVGIGTSTDSVRIVERYDPSTNAWTTLGSASSWFADAFSATVNGFIKALPINNLDRSIDNSGEIFDSSTGLFSPIASETFDNPNHRWAPVYFTQGGRLYLAGGETNYQSNVFYTNTLAYSGGASGTWSVANGALPVPPAGEMNSLQGAGVQMQPFAFGATGPDSSGRWYIGGSQGGPISPNQGWFWRFDPSTNTYAVLARAPSGWEPVPSPANLLLVNDVIYSFALNFPFKYDIATDRFLSMATPPSNGWLVPVLLNGVIYGFESLAPGSVYPRNVYSYAPATNTWTNLNDPYPVDAQGRLYLHDASGVYVIQARIPAPAGSLYVAPTLYYWTPGASPRRTRSWAAVIG